jgi:diguanylate cyclase (GGDEF)-like protein/PAS domain S-box-containing protein
MAPILRNAWANNDMTSTALRRFVADIACLALLSGGFFLLWLTLAPQDGWDTAFPAADLSIWLTQTTLTLSAALIGLSAMIFWLNRMSEGFSAADLVSQLDQPSVGYLIVDKSGRIEAVTPTVLRLLDKPSPDLMTQPITSVFPAEVWQTLSEKASASDPLEALSENEQLPSPQHNVVSASISTPEGRRSLEFRVNHSLPKRQRKGRTVIQINDNTEIAANRKALNNAGNQLRRMLGKGSDLVLFTDNKLIIHYANDNARNALSGDSGDLLGQPIYRYISENDRRSFMKSMQQFSQKNRNEVTLRNVLLADSDDTPASAHIVRLSAPEIPGYAIIFSVVERHLKALAESKATQARFSQVFHGTPDAILLIRAVDTMVMDFNDGFSRLLGYSREDAIGVLEIDLDFWANKTERDAVIERARHEREVIDYETTLRAANGAIVHVEISLRYVEIDNELCMLCTGRDITKRISAEAALIESEEKFEKVFSQSPDGIVILRTSDGVVTDLNDAILHRSGYAREEIIGQSIYEMQQLINTDDMAAAAEILSSEGVLANRAVSFITKSGESVPSLISATIVELSGEAHIMVIAKDVSKQRITEQRLRSSEERFRGIFENAPIGIMLVDMQGRVSQSNRTAADLLAYDEKDMFGIHISRLVPSEDRAALKEKLNALTVKEINTDRAERRMICRDGLEIWTNFHVVLQQNSSGDGQYYIVQIADISDIKRSQQRMERMAFYDTLTDLANRRLFHERLDHAIEHSRRAESSSALLYLDLDNFKRVNDTLGHQIGDHLLREVAARLEQCVRAEDTVGRTGGDEFTILLAEIGSPTDAGVVAQKILNHLREPIHVSGHPLIVTTSIGITVIPGDSVDPNELMRNADLAMYKAKERGRNNYQFYSEDLNINAAKRLRTEYEIRQALDNGEFELYYQPKIDITSREVVGVESLIRWNHPERGLLGPDEFIGVAEETGSIIDIGTWVIEEACRACQCLTTEHNRPVKVAINISPRQFRDPNLVATMRRSLRETALDAKNIEVEITETMLMQDVDAAQITLQRLSDLGLSLAIDDFGTGYSSLNYLKRFPINTVKVDRSFVMDIPSSPDDMAITRAVIAMAHQLKMEVVAEGVETQEQFDFLAEQRCEFAQGWLFSKALTLDEASAFMRESSAITNVS